MKTKMMYFKNELENRETNYTQRFIANQGDGAIVNTSLLRSRAQNGKTKQSKSTTRRKGAIKKKKQAATSSKLPKIA